jgi:hypothetical protein
MGFTESLTFMERLISNTLNKDSSPTPSSHIVTLLMTIDPKIREAVCVRMFNSYHFSAEKDFA